MTTFRSRGEIAQVGDIVQLRVLFRGSDGQPADTNLFPEISIQQPSGTQVFDFSSRGVYRVSTGVYGFDYEIDKYANFGIWTDNWRGSVSGSLIYQTLQFVVNFTQQSSMNTDGYVHLGDDVGYDFSQNAICNINKLIKLLKARLNSSGKSVSTDEYGNKILVDCDIYTVDQLVTFLINGLYEFNGIPHFTNYTFDDSEFIELWGPLIIQRALIDALASKALIERGREFDISDNGESFKAPTVSELLSTQYAKEYDNWYDKIKEIKKHLKPAALGLGVFSMSGGANPAYAKLRHLRSRQFY